VGANNVKLSGASYSLGLNNDAFINGLKKAELALSSWGEAIKNHGRNVASAGALMMAPFIGALSSATSFAREITRIAAETGIGVEALSMLDTMAALTGNSLQQLANVYIKLTDAAGKLWRGNAEVASAFGELRLTWQQVRGMDPETLFTEVLDRLAALKNPTDRATLGFKLFGEQFREVLPLLNQGTGGLRALQAQVDRFKLRTSAEDTRILKEMGDGLTLLWASFRQLGVEVAVSVMPVFRPLIEAISRGLLAFRQWVRENGDLARTIATVAIVLTVYGGSMLALGVTIKVVALQISFFHSLLLPLRASIGLVTAALVSSRNTVFAINIAWQSLSQTFKGVGFSLDILRLAGAAVTATWSLMATVVSALAAGLRSYALAATGVAAAMYSLYILSGLVTAAFTSGLAVWAATTLAIGLLAIAHETNNLALTSTIAITLLAATVLLNYNVAILIVTGTLGTFGVTISVVTAALVAGYAAVRALTTSYGVLRGAMIATAIASSAFAITVLLTKSLLLGIAAAAVVVTLAFGMIAKGITLAALAMKGLAAVTAIFAVIKAAVIALSTALWLALSPLLLLGLKLVAMGAAVYLAFSHGAPYVMRAWERITPFFTRFFRNIASIGGDAFAGIAASIRMGDIEGAMNIAMLSLKAAWEEFFAWLKEGWASLEPYLTNIFERVMTAIRGVWTGAFQFLVASLEGLGIVASGTVDSINQTLGVGGPGAGLGNALPYQVQAANTLQQVLSQMGMTFGNPTYIAEQLELWGPAMFREVLATWPHGDDILGLWDEVLSAANPGNIINQQNADNADLAFVASGPLSPAEIARRNLQRARRQAEQDLEDYNFVAHTGTTRPNDPGMLMKATSMGTFNGAIAGLLAPDSIDREQLRQLDHR